MTLHLLHGTHIPGTKLKRMTITKPMVDAIRKEVEIWEGYKFRAGAYGTQPFVRKLNGASSDFESELVKEVTRLCRVAGKVIDDAIESVSKLQTSVVG